MAKVGVVHCRLCGNDINKANVESWVMPSKNWYYHKECYETWAKKKKGVNDLKHNADESVWKEAIYDYLKKDLKIDLDFSKFHSQFENFLAKGYTPKGIFFTLKYIYDIKKCDTTKAQGGIGLVSHLYNEGCNYWCKKEIENKGICDRIVAQLEAFKNRERIEVLKKQTSRRGKKTFPNLSAIAQMEEDE